MCLNKGKNLIGKSFSSLRRCATSRGKSFNDDPFIAEDARSCVRFCWCFSMNSVAINLNSHNQPIFDKNKIWLNAGILYSTFRKDWKRCES